MFVFSSTARLKFDAVEVKETLYAIGGPVGTDSLTENAMEFYDHDKGFWLSRACPANLRHSHCVATVEEKIFIMGGKHIN